MREPDDDLTEQFNFKEIYGIDKLLFEAFPDEVGLSQTIREARIVAKEHLRKTVKKIALTWLTPHQKEVYTLRMSGLRYQQIADKLNINYTAVSHCIKGIHRYAPSLKRVDFIGGYEKKLKRYIKGYPEVQVFLKALTIDNDEDALKFLEEYDS